MIVWSVHPVFAQELNKKSNLYFNYNEGIYPAHLDLKIVKSDSVKAFYTTDGTLPSSSSLKIDSILTFSLDTNLVFRALIYKDGKKIEQINKSFLVGRSFSMGVVSIIVEPDNFFGYDRGIYVKGCCASEDPPYKGANFWKGWERVANIEFFEPDGKLAFNQKAVVRIFGGFSKGLPMKSLAVISKKKYGKKYFKYPIFPDKDIKKYKSFVLRNSGGDFNKSHFRDAFITNLVKPLDMEIQAYRPVVVYINGQYWGVHNMREKITEHYLKSNCGVDKDSVDILRHNKQLQYGTRKYYLKLNKFLEKNNFSDTSKIRELDKLMDIDNYINYNIAEVYVHNKDAGGNIRYWRARNDTARWRWIFYDTDLSFAISNKYAYKVNTLKQMTTKNDETWPNPPWSTFLIRKLLENDSIKQVYINRFADNLNTIFSTENVLFRIDSTKKLIEKEMPTHFNRWNYSNLDKWKEQIERMREFARKRPSYMRKFIMEKFDLKDTVLVTVNITHPLHGKIKLNSLSLNQSFSGYYFSGIPIELEAVPDIGYFFSGWATDRTQSKIRIAPDSLSVLSPKFMKLPYSKHWKEVVINELCLKSDTLASTKDWIELYNKSDTTVNIKDWKIVINNQITVLKQDKSLKPKEYYVIARSPHKLTDYYKNINISSDSLIRGIPSNSGSVGLLDKNGRYVDSIHYDVNKNFKVDSIQLPIILEKVNPNQESNIANWNVNNQPTIGKRNRAYVKKKEKKDKSFIGSLTQKQKTWGGIALFILFVLIISLIIIKVTPTK